MFEEKHSVLIMAIAVTFLCVGGIYTTFNSPTVTGSIVSIDALTSNTYRIEHYRLVLIEPHVAMAHEFITEHPHIQIQQRYGPNYVALVPIQLIPRLKTMAHVEFHS